MRTPTIIWKCGPLMSLQDPMLLCADSSIRLLSTWDRVLLFLHITNAQKLNNKYMCKNMKQSVE